MNAERSSRIELLNSSNYEVWRIRMKAVLLGHDKWGYVSGNIPAPDAGSGDRAATSALNKWKENDEKALAEIILSVGEAELRSISNCTTSKEAWEKLQSIYASKGPVRKIELLTDITSFKIDEDDDFRGRLDKFSSAVEQLAGMKIDIPTTC
ncbi:Similar to RE2: Retrovirus-related Pol polyprotein from transposon RE2 (Arabidopsis thaliana) [Cotesia congregata]|uniref:Similar to RE2: Retrovirus-related Pol polyprotein from transposon RE2 (Arabidopsis thaliana) n=1 Tax=Cotesia congregata TaxID=51543 RepID=A0A8J2H4Z3_COTCN|nr:Similar to RE2: Retrovirus-related Pol polyprotein from transposon RE2 (Arabidopsis thaliana) [Cotesia congregata]